MTCGVRPGTTAAAASHLDSARPGDIAAGRVPALTGSRVRAAFRRGRPWVWVLAVGVVAAAVARAPGAASDVRAAVGHLGGPRVWWLSVAVAAEIVSLAGGAGAQRQLLAAGGAYLPWRTVSALVLASTGLARVMPAGPVTGGAWQVREYRRRGAGTAPGVWAVLAGGFTSMVVISALLLAGAAVAGAGGLPLLACAAGALAVGAAGLCVAARRGGAAAVIVYRVTGYWTVGATGAAVAAALARRRPPGPLHPNPRHGRRRPARLADRRSAAAA